MKVNRKMTSLIFGSILMFGAGVIVANATTNDKEYNKSNMAYTQLSSYGNYNDNYSEEEESFFREMYNYCHGNRIENQGKIISNNKMMSDLGQVMNY